MALGAASGVTLTTGIDTDSAQLGGSMGYAFCTDGNDSEPCPFYLGSFSATASSSLTATLICDDESQQRVTLENLSFALAQPAFGIAETGTAAKGFPRGSLIFDSSFEIGSTRYEFSRPTTEVVTALVDGPGFSASALELLVTVPCNSSQSTVRLLINLTDPGTGATIEEPPSVSIKTPVNPPCGHPRKLKATAKDGDGDLESLRWRIDGVLVSTTVTEFTPIGTHLLEAIARDERGATTTDLREVACH